MGQEMPLDDAASVAELTRLRLELQCSRKEIEETRTRLSESEARLALALEGSRDDLWEWDLQTGQGRFSPHWKKALGYGGDELGDDFTAWEAILHPEDKPKVLADLQMLLKGQTAEFVNEHRERCKDGRWKWMLGHGVVIRRQSNGRPALVAGTIRDIDERKSVEEALRLSEERLSLALEGAHEALWDWDMRTNEGQYSKHWKEILGYSDDELRNEYNEWESRVHPDDLARVHAEIKAHVEGKTRVFYSEHRQRCKDGSWKWLLGRAKIAAWGDDGKPARMIGTLFDITERKQMEDALKESEEKYRQLFENTSASILMLDITGKYLMLNEETARTLGGKPEDFVGKNLRKIFPAKADLYLQRIREIVRIKKPLSFDEEFQLASGKRWISYTMQPIFNRFGEVTSIQTISIDITERKRAEKELRINEERWKFALEGAGDCVWDWNAETGQITFSKGWKEMLGYAEGEASPLDLDWMARIHPDDLPGIVAHQQEVQDGKTAEIRHETRMQCKDGSWKWILSRGRVIRHDEKGTPLRIVGTNSDITERKEMEKALRTSEERWQFALEGAGEGVWDRDFQTDEIIYSKRWKEMLGYAENEIGASYEEWKSRTHTDDLPAILESERAILAGETSSCIHELRMKCKDGNWKWILSRGMVTSRDTDGRPLRIVGTHSDISERRRSEDALRESENRFRLMFERTADALLLLDPQTGHFIDCNQATIDMLHCQKKEEILSRSPAELSPPHQPDGQPSAIKAKELIALALQKGSHRFEWLHSSPYRPDFPVEVLLTPIQMNDRQLLITTWRDITERKQAEEKLRLTLIELEEKRREAVLISEARSRFLNAASHDLRQPLYAIQLFSDALQDDTLPQPTQDTLHHLRTSVRAMSAQLQMLLDVSRLDMGDVKPKKRKHSIENIFQTLDATYSPIAEHAGVRLHLRPLRGYVHTDLVLITRLVGNLIDNAIKFSPDGTVLVGARRSGKHIRIEVRDNGPGIPAEHRERIFDEYYQINNPARNPDAGLGLGLSITQRMVNLLDARMTMRTHVGKGTLFAITLLTERPEPLKKRKS